MTHKHNIMSQMYCKYCTECTYTQHAMIHKHNATHLVRIYDLMQNCKDSEALTSTLYMYVKMLQRTELTPRLMTHETNCCEEDKNHRFHLFLLQNPPTCTLDHCFVQLLIGVMSL